MAQFDPNRGRAILERSRQRRVDCLRGLLIHPRRRGQASDACFGLPRSFTTVFLPIAAISLGPCWISGRVWH